MNDKEIKRFIRTGLLIGIGAASVTKDKVNYLAKKVTKAVKQGNINEKEGRKALDKMLNKSKSEQKRIEKIVNAALKEITKPYIKAVKRKTKK